MTAVIMPFRVVKKAGLLTTTEVRFLLSKDDQLVSRVRLISAAACLNVVVDEGVIDRSRVFRAISRAAQ